MAAAWLDEREPPSALPGPRASPVRCGSAARRAELFFASTRRALAIVEARSRVALARTRSREGRLLERRRRQIARERRFRPDRTVSRRGAACRRCARRTRASRASSGCLAASLARRPTLPPARAPRPERTATSLLAQALADEVLKRRPRAPLDVEQPIDLPLGKQRRLGAAGLAPVGHLRQPAELASERCALLDGALEPLLSQGTSKPASRSAFASEPKVCQRATSTASDRRRSLEVACRRGPPELGAEPAQLLEQLVAREEAAREEARRALGRVPGAEVLDHRLWVHARVLVAGELAHRRRAAEPLGRSRAAPRGSPRSCSAGAGRRETRRALPRRCAASAALATAWPCHLAISLERSCEICKGA